MANRLLDRFSSWEKGKSGGGAGLKQPTSRLTSNFEEWKKKRKPAVSNIEAPQPQMQAQEPITPKPVDQIEHEQKKYPPGTTFITQAPSDRKPLTHEQEVMLDNSKATLWEKGKSVLSGAGEAFSGMMSGIGGGIESKGRKMQAEEELMNRETIERGDEPIDTGQGRLGADVEKVGRKISEFYDRNAKWYKAGVLPEYANMRDEEGEISKEKLKNPLNWAHLGGSATGSMLPMVTAVGLSGGTASGAVVGGAIMGVAEKGDASNTFRESIAKRKGVSIDNLSPEDDVLVDEMSDIYGIVSAVLESYAPSEIVGGIATKKVASNLLQRVIVETPLTMLKNGVKEGGTEWTQRFAQNLISKVSEINPEQDLLEGTTDEGLAGFAGGALMGIGEGLAPAQLPDSKQNKVGLTNEESIVRSQKEYQNAQEAGLAEMQVNDQLNPKIIKGRVDDIAQKIDLKIEKGKGDTFRSEMEGQQFENYEDFAKKAAKSLQSSLTPEEIKTIDLKAIFSENQEEKKEKPQKEDNVTKFLRSLDQGEEQKKKVAGTLSSEELKSAVKILNTAEGQANEQQKKSILQDKNFLEQEIERRTSTAKESAGKAVFKDETAIDTLPAIERKEAVEVIEKISKTNHEVAPKAKTLIETINDNNLSINEKLKDVDDLKKQLLKSKKEEENPAKKKEIQKEIDMLDSSRRSLKDAENKIDIYAVPEIEKQNFENKSTKKFQITLDNGKKVNVSYEKDSFSGATDHFEFRGMATSESGYRSDFFGKIGEGQSVEEVAKQRAEGFAEETEKNNSKKSKSLQKNKKGGVIEDNNLNKPYATNNNSKRGAERGGVSSPSPVGKSESEGARANSSENAGEGQIVNRDANGESGRRPKKRQQLKNSEEDSDYTENPKTFAERTAKYENKLRPDNVNAPEGRTKVFKKGFAQIADVLNVGFKYYQTGNGKYILQVITEADGVVNYVDVEEYADFKSLEKRIVSLLEDKYFDNDIEVIEKYRGFFKRAFKIYEKIKEEFPTIMVGEAQERTIEQFKKEEKLNNAQADFILEQMSYMGPGIPDSYNSFLLHSQSFFDEMIKLESDIHQEDVKNLLGEKETPAVDPNKTFYHGTFDDFSEFTLDKVGENTGWDNAKFGIFFGDDKKYINQFMEENRPAGENREAVIKEVKLDIKNPLDLTLKGVLNKGNQASFIVELLGGEKLSEQEALSELDESLDLGTISDFYDELYNDVENKKKMQKAGYDGIISSFGKDENNNDILEYVAFEPSQVKIEEPQSKTEKEVIRKIAEVTAEKNKYTKAEIEELVKSKETFTEEEKNILRQYEGSGGQKDGEGRGLLDEYFTPMKIIDKIWSLIENNIEGEITSIVEPSIGTGRFLWNAPEARNVVGLETNPISAKIAGVLLPNAKILNQPFEETFVDKKGSKLNFKTGYVDVVAGNPPYGKHRGKYKGLGEESKIARYEEYFLKRSLDLTREGGIVAMVIPSGFLRGKIDYAKTKIAELGVIVDAYRLPNGSFGTTDIGTDIVILKKQTFKKEGERIEPRVGMISNDQFFIDFPEKVLGVEGERKGQFGMEKFVAGELSEALKKISIDDVAINQQAKEEFDSQSEEVEMEQKTPIRKVKKEAIKKTRIAKKKKTKVQKNKKDSDKKGVFKRDAEQPHIVVSTKKEKTKEFRQGEVLSKDAQLLYDLTREDGTISGMELTEEQKKSLNFITNEAGWDKYSTDFNYYQGDVYEKLEDLERFKQQGVIDDEHYQKQKNKLEELKPKKVTINQITLLPIDKMAKEIKINGRPLLDGFIEWLRELPYDAMEGSSQWEIAGYLNGQPVRGGLKEENARAKVRRRRVANKLFKKYYIEELETKDQEIIEEKFNRTYNGYIKPDYSQYPLQVSLFEKFYKKDFSIRPIQMEGAGFLVNKGVGLLAYEVGVGKTLSGIAAISEVMRKGWAKKPLVIVPKNLKSKWIEDVTESMPGIKINDLSNLGGEFKYKGDAKELRIEDGTISIITEEGFKKIGFSDSTYSRLTANLEDVLYDSDKKSKRGKEIDKAKTEEITGLGMKKTDYPLTFEQFGFDHLTIDEAHRAKNVFSKAKAKEEGKGSNEYGAIRGAMSERGLKTYLASQYILEQNKGRNVFLLTATPFNNSPIEIYSILALMAKNRLEGMGIKNINDFISLFCEIETKYAIKASGKVEQTDQIRKFSNLQQLQKLVREYIDFRTGEEANIPRPTKEKLTPHLKMNAIQAEYVEKAQELFSPKFKNEGGTLKAIGELQKITLSPYLSSYHSGGITAVSPKELVENSPKIKYAVEAIKKAHKVNPTVGQIIFTEKGIEIFRPIKEYFVKELGYKESEVGIIDSSASPDVKDDLQDKFQTGEIRVLLASGTVKEGVDLQRNSTDLYNLYLQWNPTDMIQAEGRTWRQGSFYDKVRIHYPLIQNSVDPFIFQKLEEKASRIANIFSYKGDSLDVSDIDFEGMKFDLITDPVMRVEAKNEYDRAEINAERVVVEAEIAFLERRTVKIANLKTDIKSYTEYLADARRDDEEENVKYYSDKLKKKKEELAEEEAKITKKGLDIEAIDKEVAEKNVKKQSLIEKMDKMMENFDVEIAKAKEDRLELTTGENNFDEILSQMENKDFFTHDGELAIGKLPQSMNAISDSDITRLITEERIQAEIKKFKKNTNPFWEKRFIVNIAKELVDTANGKKMFSAGLFNKYTGVTTIAQNQEEETMIEAIAHEPGHLAWMYLTDKERNSLRDYFKNKTLEEKRLLFGRTEKGTWKYDLYVESYQNDDWALIEEMAVTKAAKDYLKYKGKYSDNKAIAYIQKFIEAFVGLMNKIQSKIFGKKEFEGMDIMREIYKKNSSFFENRDYRIDDLRGLSNYLVDFGAKPSLEVQSVSLSEINLDEEVFDASEDFRNGMTSPSLLPILLKKGKNGKFDIIDGRHRLVEQVEDGKIDFLAVFDEETYRMYAREEESLQEAKLIKVRAYSRDGVAVKAHTRMGMIIEEQKENEKPLIKDGRISVFNLYKKVYSELYEGKPPAMTTLEDRKLTAGMTKRAFTLGKRFSTKEIKDNYKEVQKEIRNYIVKNIPPKNRGELMRAVINAKTKADVDIVISKVNEMVEKAKGREIAQEKKNLMQAIYQTFLDRKMIDQASGRVNGAMLGQAVQHISKDDRKKMRQLTMPELKELHKIAKTLKQDKYGRIILLSDSKLERLRDLFPENLVDKEFVTMGDIEESISNKDITGGWFGLFNKNTMRASRLVLIKNELTKKMYDKFTTAERKFATEFEDFNKDVVERYKKTTGKLTKFRDEKTDKNIIDYLENRKTEKELTTEELALADFIVKFYADSIETMKPKRLRKYYFTHTKENFMESVNTVGFGGAIKEFFNEQFMTDLYKDLPQEIAANLEYIVANNVFNPFGQPRKGKRASQDLRKAIQVYARTYFMKKHFDRLYSQSNAVRTLLPENMRRFFVRFVQSAKGRPDGLNFHPAIKKVVDIAVTWEYIKLLGLNVASGIFNITIGTIDNYSVYGLLNKDGLILGNARYVTPKGFELIKKYRIANQNVTYEMTKIMQTIPELANKILFFQLGMGEHYLRGTAFLSSITKEEYQSGEISDARMSEIRHKIGEAQPLYGMFDSPVAGRTTLGKTMMMFMTWLPTRLENWVNWTVGATRALKNEKGIKNKVIENKDLHKMIRFIAVFILASLLLGDKDRWKRQKEEYKNLFSINYWLKLCNPLEKPVWKDVQNIGFILHYLRTQELYENKGYDYKKNDLKWEVYLKRLVSPTAIKRLQNGDNLFLEGWE